MWFGKRKAAAAEAASMALPPQQKAFPDELWQGETGKMLRAIGMSPDDESNLVPTGASIDARVAVERAKHEAKVAEVNRDVAQRTAGGSVKPYFLISDPCWNGETGWFFMAQLRMFPYDDWNVVYLPADERTARMLNLPLHPGGPIPGMAELVESFVRESQGKMQAASAEAKRTGRFAVIAETQDSIKRDVWGLASYLANHIGAPWTPHGPR
jgi:hypothetical protein